MVVTSDFHLDQAPSFYTLPPSHCLQGEALTEHRGVTGSLASHT